MKKKVIIAIIIGVIGVGSLFMFGFNSDKDETILVKTASVSKGNVKDYLSTSGVIKSENSKDYYGPQGKVTKVNVSVGDKVKKGDVLMEFDVDDMQSTVYQAEIQYNNAVLSRDLLVSNNKSINDKVSSINSQISKINDRIADLESLDDSSVQGQINELKAQRSSLIQSRDSISTIPKEQIKQAENSVDLAKNTLDKARISAKKVSSKVVADFNGVVTAINASVDSIVASPQPVCTVQDIEDLKLSLNIGKFDSNFIELGQKALIQVGDQSLEGEVTFISPTATATQGEATLAVDVALDGFSEELKINFTQDVDILVNESDDTTRVPMEAIKYTKDGTAFVYVVSSENKVKEVKVHVGVESDTFVEVLTGISAGDTVILNPNDSIVDGIVVQPSNKKEV